MYNNDDDEESSAPSVNHCILSCRIGLSAPGPRSRTPVSIGYKVCHANAISHAMTWHVMPRRGSRYAGPLDCHGQAQAPAPRTRRESPTRNWKQSREGVKLQPAVCTSTHPFNAHGYTRNMHRTQYGRLERYTTRLPIDISDNRYHRYIVLMTDYRMGSSKYRLRSSVWCSIFNTSHIMCICVRAWSIIYRLFWLSIPFFRYRKLSIPKN